MKNFHKACSAAAAALLLSGCATMDSPGGMNNKTTSAAVGGGLGCAAGAVIAKLTGGNALTGCVAGGVVGGLVGFEKARQDELKVAEQTRQDAVQAMASLPRAQQARASQIKTVDVQVTDKASQQKKTVKAFDMVTVDMPLSSKGTPQHEQAMGKLKQLATQVADERGDASIIVAQSPADIRAGRVNLDSGVTKTSNGNTIAVSKVSDSSVPSGVERITIKAGNLKTEV